MIRNYFLEDLSEDDFESLVGTICYQVLGMGTIVFTKGKDGAKDARFNGKANKFPSEQSPWEGMFIIQAKHTTNPIASCSDGDFCTNKDCIINQEISRLKQLIEDGFKFDNYLLFTNRKYTGIKGEKLLESIKDELK